MLMGMGSLATVGLQQPKNFSIVVLDNEVYGETGGQMSHTASAADLVKRVDEPNYGYLYDTFHFNIEEDSLSDVIPATIGQMNHVHISENNRGVPGAGHIPFRSVFAALKNAGYDGWMTIEAFGSALPDLAAATKIWRPIFERPEDVYERGYRLMREGWNAA